MAESSINQKLEIFVFTYNRAASLRKLLGAFSKSPFAGCQFTVLDNCSTDGTADVCREMAGAFPRLRHVRHPKNIGGLANYLRAVELTQAEYTWVLCDDDDYRFDCEDLLREMEEGKTDVISVGLEGHNVPTGFKGGVRQLAEETRFFFEHSLVSTLIWRTELYTSDLIRKAYDNVYTMFPHFPFLASLVERNVSIYTCRKKMIAAGINFGYSGFAYLRGWLQSVVNIPHEPARSLAYKDVFTGKPYWHILIFSILIERSFRRDRYKSDYFKLWRAAAAVGPLTLLKVLVVAPLVLMPEFLHKALWKRYKKYRAEQGKPLPNFDEDR